MICLRTLQNEKKLFTAKELRFFIQGGTQVSSKKANPCSQWLTDKQWNNIEELANQIPAYKNLDVNFEQESQNWFDVFQAIYPYQTDQNWPTYWEKNLTPFHRLFILRILRPDCILAALQNIVTFYMGQQFIQIPQFNINEIFRDSTAQKPIVFIMSTGSDPKQEIIQLAKNENMIDNLIMKSMGQGQGEQSSAAILQATIKGQWVYLQNCHLSISFMDKLEQHFENLNSEIHKDFRLILTLMPFKEFPFVILQNGIKVTFESPSGIKNSLIRSYQSIDWNLIKESNKPIIALRLLYGLSFFHAIVIERKKYGPNGWNVSYEFNISDLLISFQQTLLLLNSNDDIKWDALYYLIAEANYGGRVTDSNDRRLLNVILRRYFNQNLIKESKFQLTSENMYIYPGDIEFKDYLDYFQNQPINEPPSLFNLHNNSNIKSYLDLSNNLCLQIQELLPKNQNDGDLLPQDVVREKTLYFLSILAQELDYEKAIKNYPVTYLNSMNIVLHQEIIRYNNLLQTIRIALNQLIKALDGRISMTDLIENLFYSIFDNKQPDQFKLVSFPSLKPLASYLQNVNDRIFFLQNWIDNGQPSQFWICGFFFVQSFFTGILQNYSRKTQTTIDKIQFNFIPVSKLHNDYDVNQHPNDGCYIYGLYLDGCSWNDQDFCIDEQFNNILFSNMAHIYCLPVDITLHQLDFSKSYLCPVYRTTIRKGDLTSTSHSTNFIIYIYLPISKNTFQDHWILRGTAMVTQLND